MGDKQPAGKKAATAKPPAPSEGKGKRYPSLAMMQIMKPQAVDWLAVLYAAVMEKSDKGEFVEQTKTDSLLSGGRNDAHRSGALRLETT